DLIAYSRYESAIDELIEIGGTALAFYLMHRIIQPVQASTHGSHETQHGQNQTSAPVGGPQDVTQVASQFDQMISSRNQVEKALHDSEARLRLLVNQLPTMVWTTDADLRFTSGLGKGFHYVNVQPSSVVGHTLFEAFNIDDPELPAIRGHRQ